MTNDDTDICKATTERIATQLMDFEQHQAVGILSAILARYAVLLDNVENEGRTIVIKTVESSYYGLLDKMRAKATKPLPREAITKSMLSSQADCLDNDSAIQIADEMHHIVENRLTERLVDIGVSPILVKDGDLVCLRSNSKFADGCYADYYYHTTFLVGLYVDREGFELYDNPKVKMQP